MDADASPRRGHVFWPRLLFAAVLVGGCVAVALVLTAPDDRPRPGQGRKAPAARRLTSEGRLTLWWDGLPADLRDHLVRTGEQSNVHPRDYAGPDSCKRCHKDKYESWSRHPHRWMNALADETTVKGDFSGPIAGRGGGLILNGPIVQRDRRRSRVEEFDVVVLVYGGRTLAATVNLADYHLAAGRRGKQKSGDTELQELHEYVVLLNDLSTNLQLPAR